MNKKNGINKVNTYVQSSKFGINQSINSLSQKNAKKAKNKNTTNKIKKTNSPKNSMTKETKYKNPKFPFSSVVGERAKTKISQSVNIFDDNYNDINNYYYNENSYKKKDYKKDLKKSSNTTNNKVYDNKERTKKLKESQRLIEEEKKKKEKEKERQKEKERLRLQEQEKKVKESLRLSEEREKQKEKERLRQLEKEKKERERREKEFLEKEKEKEKEKENQRLKALEEENEKERKRKKEKEEREKKERLEREIKEKEEKEKKEKLEKEKAINELKKKEKIKESSSITTKSDKKTESDTIDSSEASSITKSKIGLRNLGNTCFMNTCLQNLIHSEYFIIKLISKSSLLSSKTKISKQFYSLCKEVSSCVTNSCSPYDFKSAFGSKHSMFSGYSQHDTQEFCRILLEDMNSELNEVLHPAPYKELSTLNKSKIECNKEFDEVFRKRENSLIMDVFYGQLINIFKCECDFETYSFEKILDLPLLLQKRTNIDIKDLLKDYFECERIKFETKCEKCKNKEWHTKEIKISQPPNILILSLQRQNPRTGTKNSSYVKFYDEIDMSEYLDHECWNKNDAKYTLYGIGNHTGSIDFGHYYAYIKINNTWYEFNDSSVSIHSKDDDNNSSKAYVLFYKKNNI